MRSLEYHVYAFLCPYCKAVNLRAIPVNLYNFEEYFRKFGQFCDNCGHDLGTFSDEDLIQNKVCQILRLHSLEKSSGFIENVGKFHAEIEDEEKSLKKDPGKED